MKQLVVGNKWVKHTVPTEKCPRPNSIICSNHLSGLELSTSLRFNILVQQKYHIKFNSNHLNLIGTRTGSWNTPIL